jgi:hypothetical protein
VRDDEDGDLDGGREGRGDLGLAKSIVASSSAAASPDATSIEIVATSSVFTAVPQEWQKRAALDNSVPQDAHLAMKNSRYSLPQTWDVGPQTKLADPDPRF